MYSQTKPIRRFLIEETFNWPQGLGRKLGWGKIHCWASSSELIIAIIGVGIEEDIEMSISNWDRLREQVKESTIMFIWEAGKKSE